MFIEVEPSRLLEDGMLGWEQHIKTARHIDPQSSTPRHRPLQRFPVAPTLKITTLNLHLHYSLAQNGRHD